jgi:hypothetical protein
MPSIALLRRRRLSKGDEFLLRKLELLFAQGKLLYKAAKAGIEIIVE